MTPGKKRKLGCEPGSQTMSAVALRRKHLKEKAASAPVEEGEQARSNPQHNSSNLPEPADEDISPPSSLPSRASSRARQEPVGDPSRGSDSSQTDSSLADRPASLQPIVSGDASKRKKPVQHSTFKPTKQNYQRRADGSLLLKLPEGERLVLLGSYGVRVRGGQVTLAGAILRPSDKTYWVHSPHCHALPVLRCSDDTSLELRPHFAAANLRRLERLSPTFGRLWNEDTAPSLSNSPERDTPSTFRIVYTPADAPRTPALQELVIPAEWNKKITELAQTRRTDSLIAFICGPKSSGKSTFSKLLANRLLTDDTRVRSKTWPGVAVLDVDPGQPEFSTPGNLSLVYLSEPNLSPPFCHPHVQQSPNRILRSHALASISPATDPEHYIECVLDLYATYQQGLRGKCPLIINTPGWVQGTGLDLLTDLTMKLRPTEVIYMSQEGPEETVYGLKFASRSVPPTELASQASEYTSRTALHLRSMQTMSYFHLDLAASSEQGLRWDATPLNSVPPWTVRFKGSSNDVLGIICYDYQPTIELLADAINGSVVSIVEIEDGAAFRNVQRPSPTGRECPAQDEDVVMCLSGQPSVARPAASLAEIQRALLVRTPEGLPFLRNIEGSTLDPRHSRTIGQALLRGIDVEKGELHLLSPVPPEEINEIVGSDRGIVLVSGRLDPPTWAYTEDLYNRSFNSPALEERGSGSVGVDVTNEDTEDDTSENQDEAMSISPEDSDIPWVEVLRGGQRRAVGSRVWRVRRDLGKGGNTTD